MANFKDFINTVDDIINNAKSNEIIHLSTSKTEGCEIEINEKKIKSFSSCSYLGLEFDPRVKKGAINAIEKFGTQFSASRAYISIDLYDQLEDKFDKIFNAHSIVAPTTTLGHIATIPTLINEKTHAIILDHQVHASVQNAVNLTKPHGVHVEMIRHNRIDLLEEKIKSLREKFTHIWYMADGIYSMYGDTTPILKLEQLLDKYPEFHTYIDDAHGMSCFGENGSGYVLSKINLHPKMILALSMAKAYATGGGIIIFPTKELKSKIRNCGGPLLSSGPLQPANLGAALEVAKIHLSNEIYSLQDELNQKITFANKLIGKYNLPTPELNESPVFFIAVSFPKLANIILKKMLNYGYYLNLGIYPTVPIKNTGVRFTITRLNSFDDIQKMISTLAQCFYETIEEEEIDINKIYKAFKLKNREEKLIEKNIRELTSSLSYKIKRYSSINEIDKTLWNNIFKNRGAFDWDSMKLYEKVYSKNLLIENNWDFDYLEIKDSNNKIVLMTFFTTCLMKDDMLSSSVISENLEKKRKESPYLSTSKVLMMGTLLTQGNHLFIESNEKDKLLNILTDEIEMLTEKRDVTDVYLRDFINPSKESSNFISEKGFLKLKMGTLSTLNLKDYKNEDDFFNLLSKRSKKHFRQNIKNNREQLSFKTINSSNLTDAKLDKYYNLYLQVKNNNYSLNTFNIPFSFFQELLKLDSWEIIEMSYQNEIICFAVINTNEKHYNCMYIGMNYEFQNSLKVYQNMLYHTFITGRNKDLNVLNWGFTGELEKRKLNADQTDSSVFIQIKDNFKFESLEHLNQKDYLINV